MAKNILFVTRCNKEYEEGFSYVVELSMVLKTGISVLMIYDKSFLKSFEDQIVALVFAEAGETEIAREISSEQPRQIADDTKKRADALMKKYCKKGEQLDISFQGVVGDVASNIKKIVKNDRSIDMILLSPSVSNKRFFNVRKHLKGISRPVVTMSKPSNVGA